MKRIVLLIIVAALLLSCQQNKTPENGEITVALFWLDSDIEPTTGWNGWTLSRLGVGENLIQVDENMDFKPGIADRYEQVDAKTYHFHIRDNAYFHNGKKVSAESVKNSIERALAKTNRKDVTFELESVVADGQELSIVTTQAIPTLLNYLADPVYIIVDANSGISDEELALHPIGTGPFKVISFDPNEGLELEKHTQHWDGKTNIDLIHVKYIQDGSLRTMALQSGELDLGTQIPFNDLKLFNSDKYTVQKGPNLRIFFLRVNFGKPYMKQIKFRQALAHAVDISSYAEKLSQGIPAYNGPFNPSLPYSYTGDYIYNFDLDISNTLLDELGYHDTNGNGIREYEGQDINLVYIARTNHGQEATKWGTVIQQQFKKIGIGLEIRQVENDAQLTESGQYDLKWERWSSAPTADSQYFVSSSFGSTGAGNVGHYSNPEIDNIISTLDSTFAVGERNLLGQKASQVLVEDVAALFLYYQEGNIVTSSRIDGVHRFLSEMYYIDERIRLK